MRHDRTARSPRGWPATGLPGLWLSTMRRGGIGSKHCPMSPRVLRRNERPAFPGSQRQKSGQGPESTGATAADVPRGSATEAFREPERRSRAVAYLALLWLLVACSGAGTASTSKEDRGAGSSTATAEEGPADRAEDINGVYTFTVTERAIRAAGGTDQDEINENTGQMTVRFEDGYWSMKQVYSQGPKAGTLWYGTGDYQFDGRHFKIFYSPDPGDWTTADVAIRAADGALVFGDIHDGDGSEDQAISEAWYTVWMRKDR